MCSDLSPHGGPENLPDPRARVGWANFLKIQIARRREPIERSIRKVFCILGLPRSGTTWLVDLLDRHPLTHCSNEVLIRDPFVHGVPLRGVPRPEVTSCGFKILEWQNSWWLPSLMRQPDVPVVLLWRENAVRHLYSITAARRSGIYHDKPVGRQLLDRIRHGSRALAMGELRYAAFAARTTLAMSMTALLGRSGYRSMPLRIAPAELDRHLEARSQRIGFLRYTLKSRGGPWWDVRYEQLAGPSHSDTMHRILEFLGLPPAEMGSSVRRLNAKPLRELLQNHDELEEHCRKNGIPFE